MTQAEMLRDSAPLLSVLEPPRRGRYSARIMSVEDRVITVAARRVLTTMWVDITSVNVRVTRGVIYLTGHLQRMTASHSDFGESTLRELDMRLRSIRQARDVKYRLDNWQRNFRGEWLPGSSHVIGGSTTSGAFEMSDEPTSPGAVD